MAKITAHGWGSKGSNKRDPLYQDQHLSDDKRSDDVSPGTSSQASTESRENSVRELPPNDQETAPETEQSSSPTPQESTDVDSVAGNTGPERAKPWYKSGGSK
jgi:hypothetical protein